MQDGILIKKPEWYSLDLRQRHAEIYSKYSIRSFFEWWAEGNKEEYMEIRFENWEHAKECSKRFKLPYNKSSVFIRGFWQLENIITHYKKKSNMWFGINPRRFLPNRYGRQSISGLDINISRIKFLFIDIDRVKKDGPADKEALMNADILSEYIKKELDTAGFANEYVKICSGNGVQLLFKLDIPIDMPVPPFNEKLGAYIEDGLFIETKQIFMKGIKKVFNKVSKHFAEKYNVEIDNKVFNIGRIGALPGSFNFKYKMPVPRGMLEFRKDGKNDGLSDYLRELYESVKTLDSAKRKFTKNSKLLMTEEYDIKHNELKKNIIVNLMLNYRFPSGGINNTLWYAVKILLHRNGITKNDNEYIVVHTLLKKLHNRGFTDNGLEPSHKNKYDGSIKEDAIQYVPGMVNKYLRLNKIERISDGKIGYHKPLFSVSPNGRRRLDIQVKIPTKVSVKKDYKYDISSEKEDPIYDIIDCSKKLYEIRTGNNSKNPVSNVLIMMNMNRVLGEFIPAFVNKWGEDISRYMISFYMDDYFNYKRL